MGRAIGIDLGTTNTCAAVVIDGRPRVVTYEDGERTIPSVFAIDKSGSSVVGKDAKSQAAANPMNTVAASKRLIGRSFGSDAVEKMSQVFTYEVVEGTSNDVLVKVSGQVLTLEQISAAILQRVKQNAETFLGEKVNQAVITVPAYFNDRQRQAVRAAGRLAGLHVLRVLNEPTAAALAYGLGRTLNQRVAIYDLGGGTFDISVIDIKDKVFEVVATGGDTFLGGVDFDDRVMQHCLQRFADEEEVDLSYDRSAITRLRDASEQAKIDLSSATRTRIHIPNIAVGDDGEPLHFDMELTRDELESLTRDLVDRSIRTCERILGEAGTSAAQLDELLLVGGQSRMPLVRQSLSELLNRPPSEKVHPDEAVAFGAAIMAHSLARTDLPADEADLTLRDVLPMPIGVNKPDGTMAVLFERNAPLPARKSKTIVTSKNNQDSIMVRIYQGDTPKVADCELLGSFVFYGLRPAPRGRVRLRVQFHIDSEGILNVTAADRDTGEAVASHIRLDRPVKAGSGRRAASTSASAGPALDLPTGSAIAPDELEEIEPELLDDADLEELPPEPAVEPTPPQPPPAVPLGPPGPDQTGGLAALRRQAADRRRNGGNEPQDAPKSFFARMMSWFTGGGK